MKLRDKHILITGASGGIGSALAIALAKRGSQLLLCARDPIKLQQVLEQLPGEGHRTLCVDINKAADRAQISATALHWGLDIVINNAAINELALLEDMDEQQIEQIIRTNLLSPIQLCSRLIPVLKEAESAYIVNIGSILGSIGFAGSSVYCASKFAILGFSEALRRELADSSIKLIYVAPRAVDTALNSDATVALNKALGNRVDQPQEVAQHVLKCIEKNTVYRYLGWPESLFIRLNKLLPKLVDRFLRKQLPIIKHWASQQSHQDLP